MVEKVRVQVHGKQSQRKIEKSLEVDNLAMMAGVSFKIHKELVGIRLQAGSTPPASFSVW
jgi:hypothetical protein